MSSTSKATILYNEDFESDNNLKGFSILRVSDNPYNGNYHALTSNKTGNSANYQSSEHISLNSGTQYCLSFFAAYGSHSTNCTFNIWLGEELLARVSSRDFIMRNYVYTNIVVPIQLYKDIKGELKLEVVVDNGLFNDVELYIDDLILKELRAVWVIRPEPTSAASNLNGLKLDVLTSLRVQNQLLFNDKLYTADGYRWLTKPIQIISNHIDVEITFGDGEGAHHLLVWVDLNCDGEFQEDECVLKELIKDHRSSYKCAIPFLENQPDGEYLVRIRYLQGNHYLDAVSGRCWGETKDFVLFKYSQQNYLSPCHQLGDVCKFYDLSGREVLNLDEAPFGIYIERCGDCVRKVYSRLR